MVASRQSPAPDTSDGEFDLVLYGFRNDLAREQTLTYLAALLSEGEAPASIDRRTPLPRRLFSKLPESRARELQAALERFGAQVAVAALHQPTALLGAPSRRSRVPLLAAVVVLALGLGVVWQALQPDLGSQPAGAEPEADLPAPQAAPLMALEAAVEPRQDHQQAAMNHNGAAVELANQGNFDAAVDQLQEALRFAPAHPVIIQNLQTVLVGWALRDIEGGQLPMALAHLNDALALGERGDIRRALGFAHLQTGDYIEARADLERAVEAGSNDAWSWMALGEANLKLHDRARALDALQSAREAGASSPQLEILLDRLGREVDAEWNFAALESRHFRVSFADGENRGTARLVLMGLEEARGVVGERLGHFPDEVTEVVLYGAEAFHAITQTPKWAGGAYDGRIKLPVGGLEADGPSLGRVLRHEYSHSLVAILSGRDCPTWLNEGLAVWAEEEWDGERLQWAESVLTDASLFRLTELDGSLLTSIPLPRVQVAYAESYLAVRELISRYGARELPVLLGEIGRQPFASAFAAVYFENAADFEERFLRSLGG